MNTISDVAKQAGVSARTVSRVVNGGILVSEETQRKVKKAIRELNFTPNETARNLKLMHLKKNAKVMTKNIGCIIFADAEFSDQYYSRIFDGINRETIRQKYHLLFLYTINQIKSDETIISNMVSSEKIDGLILIGVDDYYYKSDIFKYINEKIKNVVHVTSKSTAEIDNVTWDNAKAGYEAVKYLAGLGHRKIGFIGYADSESERYAGFTAGIRDMGLEQECAMIVETTGIIVRESVNIKYSSDYDAERGFMAMTRIFENNSSFPTAVFACNDKMAIGAMKAIRQKGLKVPDDISVIGCNDIEMAEYVYPPLTTFRIKKEDLGGIAVRKLMEHIRYPDIQPAETLVPIELIVRESCRKI